MLVRTLLTFDAPCWKASRSWEARLVSFRRLRQSCGAMRDSNAGEGLMQTLLVGVGIYVALWIIVLWGARYFGPRDA
jgi:hypothetical protein